MSRMTRTIAGMSAVAALVTVVGCGGDTEKLTASVSPATPQGPAAPAGPRPGIPEGNVGLAEDVADWLSSDHVDEAVSGTVADVVEGPAVTMLDRSDVVVTTTALVLVKVERSYRGAAKPGNVVPVVLTSSTGSRVKVGAPVPTRPGPGGTSITEFKKGYPVGTRVVAMGDIHPINILQGGASAKSYDPPGLLKRATYMFGMHPQAFSLETVEGQMTGWEGIYRSYDEVIAALDAATAEE